MSAARNIENFRLPLGAYLPGKTARPAEGSYDWIRDQTPDRVDEQNIREVASWRYGLRLLREGFYWEAHEVLEPVWMACAPNTRERYLVQAVIQIANAALKAELVKTGAAAKLCILAVDLLARAGSKPLLGLHPKVMQGRLNGIVAAGQYSGQDIAHAVFG